MTDRCRQTAPKVWQNHAAVPSGLFYVDLMTALVKSWLLCRETMFLCETQSC